MDPSDLTEALAFLRRTADRGGFVVLVPRHCRALLGALERRPAEAEAESARLRERLAGAEEAHSMALEWHAELEAENAVLRASVSAYQELEGACEGLLSAWRDAPVHGDATHEDELARMQSEGCPNGD